MGLATGAAGFDRVVGADGVGSDGLGTGGRVTDGVGTDGLGFRAEGFGLGAGLGFVIERVAGRDAGAAGRDGAGRATVGRLAVGLGLGLGLAACRGLTVRGTTAGVGAATRLRVARRWDFFAGLGFAAGAGRSVPVRRAPKRSATRALIAATFAVISSLLTCGRAVVVVPPSPVFTPPGLAPAPVPGVRSPASFAGVVGFGFALGSDEALRVAVAGAATTSPPDACTEADVAVEFVAPTVSAAVPCDAAPEAPPADRAVGVPTYAGTPSVL